MAKTPISLLQELMAVQHLPLPIYREEGFGTDFQCAVLVKGITAIGRGSSKKTAKHESARLALEILSGKDKPADKQETCNNDNNVPLLGSNFVGLLNEMSSKNGWGYPTYDFVSVSTKVLFIYECAFLDEKTFGCGYNKKEAKQQSAMAMWELVKTRNPSSQLEDYKIPNKLSTPAVVSDAEKAQVLERFKELSIDGNNPISNLQNPTYDIHPEPEIVLLDDADELKKQLKIYNAHYQIMVLQRNNPTVVCLNIVDTSTAFVAVGKTKDEAIKDVLKQAEKIKKFGLSLDGRLSSLNSAIC